MGRRISPSRTAFTECRTNRRFFQAAEWTFTGVLANEWTFPLCVRFHRRADRTVRESSPDPLLMGHVMRTISRSTVTTVAFVAAATLVIIAVLLHDVSSVLLLAGAFWLVKVGLGT